MKDWLVLMNFPRILIGIKYRTGSRYKLVLNLPNEKNCDGIAAVNYARQLFSPFSLFGAGRRKFETNVRCRAGLLQKAIIS